jgi:hypothetical protein
MMPILLGEGYGALSMIAAVAGMLAVAYAAWKVVNRREQADPDLQARLREDDERARRGLREEAGLPPEVGQDKNNARRG